MITRLVACAIVTALLIIGGTMLAAVLVAHGSTILAYAVVIVTAAAIATVRHVRSGTRVPHVVPTARPTPNPTRTNTGTLRLAAVAPTSPFVHYRRPRTAAGGASR